MGDVRVGSTFGSAITVRQVRHRTLEYFETQYCNGVASTIIESRSGRRESDQSIDQDLDLGFRSGDGKLQVGISSSLFLMDSVSATSITVDQSSASSQDRKAFSNFAYATELGVDPFTSLELVRSRGRSRLPLSP